MKDFYKLEWKTGAAAELRRVPKEHIPQILNDVDYLSINPTSNPRSKAITEYGLYRLRVGEYRVVYQIVEQSKIILLFAVVHKKDVVRDELP